MKLFTNGIMSYGRSTDREISFDADGNPMRKEEGNLRKVRVFIDALSEDKKGRYDDGRYTNASYEVSLDYDDVPAKFKPTDISIIHDRKGDLGSFTVQRIEFYDLTRTIVIWI